MPSSDNQSRWHPAVAGATLLLVDFDGPLVRLLPDPEHVHLAERLAGWYADRTGQVPSVAAVDHVHVLRHIHAEHPRLAAQAEAWTTERELIAAATRTAYADAVRTLRGWLAAGGRVAIVSNNSEDAVRRVLARAGLADDPASFTVHARRPDNLGRLKPAPDLLREAMTTHRVEASAAVMIGDTTGDVQAGQAAGVPVVGVAESAQRADELRRDGAVGVVARLADLCRAR